MTAPRVLRPLTRQFRAAQRSGFQILYVKSRPGPERRHKDKLSDARCGRRPFTTSTRTQFLPNPFASISQGSTQAPELLTASRTLPYSASSIYRIIADIESYPEFLPYCLDARITHWSRPDSSPAWSQPWPAQADLVIGWRDLRESFTSRLVCVPPVAESKEPGIVEATSGNGVSRVAQERAPYSDWSGGRAEVNGKGVDEVGMGGGSLEFLRTEWAVEDASPTDASGVAAKVGFRIEYKFSNMLYAAMGQAVVPKLADRMVEAFETRVHQLLRKKPSS